MTCQARVGAKVEETDAAATRLRGVLRLENLAHKTEPFKDLEAMLPPKARNHGYSVSA